MDLVPVIEFSTLPDAEKDRFYQFMIEHDINFFKDKDGSYIANVCMYDAEKLQKRGLAVDEDGNVVTVKELEARKSREETKSSDDRAGGTPKRARARPSSEAAVLRELRGPQRERFKSYSAVIRELGGGAPQPRKRGLPWVMRLAEGMYDARFERDTQELKEEEEREGTAVPERAPQAVPKFLVEYVKSRVGLGNLVDRNVWDLLASIHSLRRRHTQVEVFARFVEERYDADDLLFFLYFRSVLQKQLKVSLRSRWGEMGRGSTGRDGEVDPLLLTRRQVALVARAVFGSESDPLCVSLLEAVDSFMEEAEEAGDAPERTSDGQPRIDAADLLRVALEEYHETRPDDNEEAEEEQEEEEEEEEDRGAASRSSRDVDRLNREAEAEYEARSRNRQRDTSSSSSAPRASRATDDEEEEEDARDGGQPQVPKHALEELSMGLQEANSAFIDRLAAKAADMPGEVQTQIRDELTRVLGETIDQLLEDAIAATSNGNKPLRSEDPVGAAFYDFLTAAQRADDDNMRQAIQKLCTQLHTSRPVREKVEPMANVLLDYAKQRLEEFEGDDDDDE